MYRNKEMDNLLETMRKIPLEEREEDIVRTCYACKESMTLEEAAAGQRAMNQALEQSGGDFEGWVRCQGPEDQFVQEEDIELKELINELFFPFAIHVHSNCVKKMYRSERGEELREKKVEEQLPKHHSAPQTMKPQEKPNIDAEDHHLEDYSEEDLEKAKDKGKETGHTLTEPKEDELKIEPKKESKLKEDIDYGDYSDEELKKLVRTARDKEDPNISDYVAELRKRGISHIEMYAREFKQTKKGKQLYLCNECFKIFRADESICSHCQSEKVEKIVLQEGEYEEHEAELVGSFKHIYEVWYEDKDGNSNSTRVEAFDEADAEKVAKESKVDIEKITKVKKVSEGKDEPGERDGTGPVKGSYQRRKYGDKGKRKRAGEKCPYKEELPESKLHETVQELVGEVDGIDRIDQHLLNKAIEDEVIPNQFPELEVMIDELSAADVAKELGVKDIDDVDLGDIDAVYLKYILLPKAKEASRAAKESKNETLTPEQIKNLKAPKLKFSYGTVIEHKQIMEDLAKTDFFESAMVGTQVTLIDAKGIPVIYAKDDDKQWKEFSSLGFVESKLKEKEEGWSDLPDEALLTAFRVLVKEGPGSKTVGSSKDITTIFVELKKRGLEDKALAKESKLKEQEEDSFKTLAKGIEDKDIADRLAKEKEGQVVADEEDEKKFSVIVREK